MRFLFWRLEWAGSSSVKQTRVRIELQRDLQSYSYTWSVADAKSSKLNKKELHELDMKVAKYVATLNDNAPAEPEQKTVFAVL